MTKSPKHQDAQLSDMEEGAVNALVAVIWDKPEDARSILTGMSFRGRALLMAWADELKRLGAQTQTDHELRERSEWRDANRPVTPSERRTLNEILEGHLRTRAATADGRISLRDIVAVAAPYTDAGAKEVQSWAEGRLRDLVQEGVLSPKGDRPDEYLIASVPGDKASEVSLS